MRQEGSHSHQPNHSCSRKREKRSPFSPDFLKNHQFPKERRERTKDMPQQREGADERVSGEGFVWKNIFPFPDGDRMDFSLYILGAHTDCKAKKGRVMAL